jgi:hypothetical protein
MSAVAPLPVASLTAFAAGVVLGVAAAIGARRNR